MTPIAAELERRLAILRRALIMTSDEQAVAALEREIAALDAQLRRASRLPTLHEVPTRQVGPR